MNKSEKAAENTKPVQSASPPSEQQTLTFQQYLELAIHHHTVGDLSKAEDTYQQILQTDSNHPVVLHLLGVVSHQKGEDDRAVDLINKALAIKPDYAEANNNFGNALKNLGKLDEAVARYHMALAIRYDYTEAHYKPWQCIQRHGEPIRSHGQLP